MGAFSLLCVCLLFCFWTVTEFLKTAEKDKGIILHACWTTIRTGLLPVWLAGSHGGGITSGMSYRNWAACCVPWALGGIRNWGGG